MSARVTALSVCTLRFSVTWKIEDDLEARLAIEVSRWLVRQDDRWVRHDGASDGDTLLLATRHLRWLVVDARAEANSLERADRQLFALLGASIDEWQLHLAYGGHARQQVVVLEHEADRLVAHDRELIVRHLMTRCRRADIVKEFCQILGHAFGREW